MAVHFIVHNCNISNSLNLHFKLSRLKRFSRLRETSKTKFRLSDDKVSQSRSRTSAGWNENLYFDVVTAWERRKSRSFSLIARSSLQIGLNEITLILNGFVIFCGFTQIINYWDEPVERAIFKSPKPSSINRSYNQSHLEFQAFVSSIPKSINLVSRLLTAPLWCHDPTHRRSKVVIVPEVGEQNEAAQTKRLTDLIPRGIRRSRVPRKSVECSRFRSIRDTPSETVRVRSVGNERVVKIFVTIFMQISLTNTHPRGALGTISRYATKPRNKSISRKARNFSIARS